MSVSIITVNLNNRAGLKQTLASVKEQTWHDREHLVIDGGSTDGSRELLEQWDRALSFWRSEPDQGIFHAMNKGVTAAQGERVVFLNSGDTFFATNSLETLCQAHPAADIVYGNALAVSSRRVRPLTYPQTLTHEFLLVTSIAHEATLIQRKLLQKFPYDESLRIVADWKFFLQAFRAGFSFRHLDTFVTRFDATGISNRPDYHALQRWERDQVLQSIFSPSELQKLESQVAIMFLPHRLQQNLRYFPGICHRLYHLGRGIRRLQTRIRLRSSN